MFQSIDDVQMQTHDPYYEEVDTEIGTSARDHLAAGAGYPGGKSTLDPMPMSSA